MVRSPLIFLLSIIFLFTACNSNEIGNSKDVSPETIYLDYKIWGEETNDEVTVMLQFRFAGVNGTTLVLAEPSKVEFDGERITGDSSKMTGAYYEITKPLAGFEGKHTIVFTGINKKEYREEFDFHVFRLLNNIPARVERADLVLELDGLNPRDYVRVTLTDTGFVSEGINRLDTVINGKIRILGSDLKNVLNGPVHLELIREEERATRAKTEEGGWISVSYGLKRDFLLQ